MNSYVIEGIDYYHEQAYRSAAEDKVQGLAVIPPDAKVEQVTSPDGRRLTGVWVEARVFVELA